MQRPVWSSVKKKSPKSCEDLSILRRQTGTSDVESSQDKELLGLILPDLERKYVGDDFLDVAVFNASSLPEIDFMEGISEEDIPESLEFLALVRWRQVDAGWKHSEIMKETTLRRCSHQFIKSKVVDKRNDDDSTKSISTRSLHGSDIRSGASCFTAESSLHLHLSVHSKNPSIFKPHLSEQHVPIISEYLTSIGPKWNTHINLQTNPKGGGKDFTPQMILKHDVLPKNSPRAKDLIGMAESNLAHFTILIEKVAKFAVHNDARSQSYRSKPMNPTKVSHSVDIKTTSAIIRKAHRKYSGDILQVKDVLRAQFVFPDEGSLVCALKILNQVCLQSSTDHVGNGKGKKVESIDIVRIKNLFHLSPLGTIIPSDLPTGYRHLLVNIRLHNGLLAGTSATTFFVTLQTIARP